MSTPNQPSLLRRTLAALVAVASLGIGSSALAQGTVKLTGAGGKDECAFSSMSISPNGTVTVSCSGTPIDQPVTNTSIPGTFVTAAATMTAGANSVAQVIVNRTLGSLATTIWFWTGGDGCDGVVGSLSFSSGQMGNTISIPVKAAGTSCGVNLSVADPALLGSPSATTISVSASATQNPGGCPATPQNMISTTFAGPGNPLVQAAASGQIVSIKLPPIPNTKSGQVNIGETSITPQPATLEFSINKCPGVVEVNSFEGQNYCNLRTQSASMSNMTYITAPFPAPYDNAAAINSQGLCWAADGGDIYLNARWIHPSCPWGNGSCGYAMQYGNGPY